MKVIKYPAARTIAGETFDLPRIVDNFVLTQDFWRERANVRLALSISQKLPTNAPLTDPEHEALEKAMALKGQAIQPALNPYFLECLAAIYEAGAPPPPTPEPSKG